MKPRTLRLLLLACLALFPILGHAEDKKASKPPADPIVGRWRWFSNEFVYIRSDGTLTKGGPIVGKWKCVNESWPRKYELNWGTGMWIDTLFLKDNCTFLTGKNQQKHEVHGRRSDASKNQGKGAPVGSGG